ncbi:MAG: 50S ribosomal protein L22 [Patescibacteria group bacterium]|jgi:large subunit ribosomal protein L22
MDITVKNKFVRISPRKARPVLHGLRGRLASDALTQMRFTNKKAATRLAELIRSAVAAAKESDMAESSVYIKSIVCDEGPRLKRRRFESKGRAAPIKKRMSHFVLTVTDEPVIVKPVKASAQKVARAAKTSETEAKKIEAK